MAEAIPHPDPDRWSHIVHLTDLSPDTEGAFAHALALALMDRSALSIAHAGPEPEADVPWTRFPPVRGTLHRWGLMAKDSPRARVMEALDVAVEKLALPGRDPALTGARFVAVERPDLVVLATSGRQGLARWLHPSKAEAIVRDTRTNALFVPTAAGRGMFCPDTGAQTLTNVLIPVDETPDPGAGLAYARAIAARFDAHVNLHVLHVGAGPALADRPLPGAEGWSWSRRHVGGDIVSGIMAVADQCKADLIVMTTAGRDGVMDVLKGSHTEQVLRRAKCPLLAIPAG